MESIINEYQDYFGEKEKNTLQVLFPGIKRKCNKLVNYDNLPKFIPKSGITKLRINSMTNLSLFVNLVYLDCSSCKLTELPTGLVNLTELDCHDNKLTQLPTGLVNLTELRCSANKLTELPTGLVNLTVLWCSRNQLTELPTGLVNLTELRCSGNQLTILKQSDFPGVRIYQ